MNNWARERADDLLRRYGNESHEKSGCLGLHRDTLLATINEAISRTRAEERKAIAARLREDKDLLAETLALLRMQPEPDGGDSECVEVVLACLADVLFPSPPPTENSESDIRMVLCAACGSEGRDLRGHPNDPHPRDYGPCPECKGTGLIESEVAAITLSDLDDIPPGETTREGE